MCRDGEERDVRPACGGRPAARDVRDAPDAASAADGCCALKAPAVAGGALDAGGAGDLLVETPAVPVRELHRPVHRGVPARRRMLTALVAAAAMLLAVTVAGALLTDAAGATDFAAKNLAPSLAHPFGCDWMGRDMFVRTLAGLSRSLFVGVLAALCSAVIALALALTAALGGRRADAAVGFLVDLIMGVPHIVLLILISYALGRGFWGVSVGIALTHWPSLARVLRAEVLQLRSQPWMAQVRRLGVGRVRLACCHVLPAVLPQLLVGAVLMFPHAILHEASITFLGFGLSPDQPAIGVILSESMSYLSSGMWWLAVFPGAALVACVFAFDRIGALLRRLVSAQTIQG